MEKKMLPEKKIKNEIAISEYDKKHFLEKHSPMNLTLFLNENKINDSKKAILSGVESLSLVRKHYGAETLNDFVTVLLIKLNEYVFGRSEKQMTEYQISETAMLIIDTYYYLNIAEIAIVFKKIKSGAYGKVFGELNGMFVMESFAQYHIERMRALQAIDEDKQKEKIKEVPESEEYIPMPASLRRMINTIEDKFTDSQKKEVEIKACKCGRDSQITNFNGVWICIDCLKQMISK